MINLNKKVLDNFSKNKNFDRKEYIKTRDYLKNNCVHSVCVEANCPNRYDCFSKKTVTFMILGNLCTRNCSYCDVKHGTPKKEKEDFNSIIKVIKKLALEYVVITSVTRDDLEDGGASEFERLVSLIRENFSDKIKIELLIPDFQGSMESLKKVCKNIEVLNHNLETVETIFQKVRPGADYAKSLELLNNVKKINPKMYTKSGIMLGLGETLKEVKKTLEDLRKVDCDFLSIGQYIPPSKEHYPLMKKYSENEFAEIKKIALEIGFKHVESGTYVRSSYNAKNYLF